MSGGFSTIDVGPCQEVDAGWRWAAVLRSPASGEHVLWFEGGPRERELLTTQADPFVLGFLYLAMGEGLPLRIQGAPASPSLLANLTEFQIAWNAWRGFSRIEIDAKEEREAVGPGDRSALAAFSGGIDAAYTVHRHRTGLAGRQRRDLHAAVFVHGIDVPHDDLEGFHGASERAARLLEGSGVPLLSIRTNLRAFENDWEMAHGLAVAASLTALSRGIAAGLIASSGTYSPLLAPWGSNPVTDRLMGSRGFEIVHDGTEASRFGKVRALSQWPQALRFLRYCWMTFQRDRNCGRCPKCVLSQAMFRCLDLAPECLDAPRPEAEFCAALRSFPADPASDPVLGELLRFARSAGLGGPWVEALESAVERLCGRT